MGKLYKINEDKRQSLNLTKRPLLGFPQYIMSQKIYCATLNVVFP